jgi:DNA-directed RNA polymerase subunit beta
MKEGLRETIDDISPIEDYTGTLAVEFGEYEFGEPQFSIKECREKDLTYQAPLSMTVRFVNKETGEIREQRVFMGDFPMMTEQGHVHHQRHRARHRHAARPQPGAYLMEPKDATKQVFTANLMPSRGSWLELEIDKKGVVYARIDRKRKLRSRPCSARCRTRTRRPGSSSTRARTRRSSSCSTTRSSS